MTPTWTTDFEEPRALNDVAQFHRTFDLPVLDEPCIPSEERCHLRVNLIEEELNELKEAIANRDLTEIADALSDIQYVLSGAVLEFGLAHKFGALFSEVQRSNMSKTCKTKAVAIATQAHYQETKGTDSYIRERDGQFLVYRTSDHKVLKSVEYSPANLKDILGSEDH